LGAGLGSHQIPLPTVLAVFWATSRAMYVVLYICTCCIRLFASRHYFVEKDPRSLPGIGIPFLELETEETKSHSVSQHSSVIEERERDTQAPNMGP
jgi:hypothetical protein